MSNEGIFVFLAFYINITNKGKHIDVVHRWWGSIRSLIAGIQGAITYDAMIQKYFLLLQIMVIIYADIIPYLRYNQENLKHGS